MFPSGMKVSFNSSIKFSFSSGTSDSGGSISVASRSVKILDVASFMFIGDGILLFCFLDLLKGIRKVKWSAK